MSVCSVTVQFTGTSLTWVTKMSPRYGKARLTLDGGTPTIVDLYSATEVWQQKVWQSGTLEQGTHTVTIELDRHQESFGCRLQHRNRCL